MQEATTGAGLELAEVYHEHYRPLVRLAYAMTGDLDLSEDLAQEAFVRASGKLGKLRDPGAARSYLRTTVINLVRRSFKRRFLDVRTRFRLVDIPTDRADEDRVAVRQALRTLPPRQRACVALRYFEGLTEAEAADVLGVSVGTVKSQMHKALRKLGSVLEGSR